MAQFHRHEEAVEVCAVGLATGRYGKVAATGSHAREDQTLLARDTPGPRNRMKWPMVRIAERFESLQYITDH